MTYRVPVRQGGLTAAVRSLVRRDYREVAAVRDVSFAIPPGEIVGFLGPNGAGKTTTMKVLAGLLHPAAGHVRVLGCTPWQRRNAFLRQIALVRGSLPTGGSQELTLLDALHYQQILYGVTDGDYRGALTELRDLLDLGPLLDRQLRALSLGERMRAGLALALLYRPRVVFLDEPTLGLDVSASAAIRRFLAAYCAESGATILLTSHYMVDVEALCRRLILIDHGRITYDGPLADLAARLSPYKIVRLTAPSATRPDFAGVAEVIAVAGPAWTLRVPRDRVATVASALLTALDVADLAIEEPSMEDVLDRAYQGAR